MKRFYLVLWVLVLLATPFYFFGKDPVQKMLDPRHLSSKVEGGVPQVSDFLMLVLMGSVFCAVGFRVRRSAAPAVGAFAWFVAYVCAVDAVWALALEDLAPLKNMLFYIYNLLLLLTFLVLHGLFRERLLRLTMHAVAASVFLQVLLSPLSMDRSELRQRLFFNDPNQLGYYAVLSATVFLMGARVFRAHLAYQACFFAAATYLAVLSLSKSALFSLLLLSVLLLARRPVRLLLGGLLLGVAILGALSMPPSLAPPIVANFQKRMLNEGTDETPEKRGYDRIVNHPWHLFLGAGEGANHRFQSEWPGELHSSWGTLLFCYGLVGFSLFAWGLWWLLRPDLRVAVYLLPAGLYGFIQHGLRFTSFWTLLAFIGCLVRGVAERSAASREPQTAEPPGAPAQWPVLAGRCGRHGKSSGAARVQKGRGE